MIMKGGDRNTVQIRTKLYEIWDRTGPQQDSERNIVNQDRNRFLRSPVPVLIFINICREKSLRTNYDYQSKNFLSLKIY